MFAKTPVKSAQTFFNRGHQGVGNAVHVRLHLAICRFGGAKCQTCHRTQRAEAFNDGGTQVYFFAVQGIAKGNDKVGPALYS